MSKINNFLLTNSIDIIEEILKNSKSFLDDLTVYINKLIGNCQVEYDTQLNDTEEDIKNVFLQEIKTIIKNFNLIIFKYFSKKPDSLISLDLDNPWYSSEKSIVPKEINPNPYISNKIISKILTIVCKLIDFLNDYYLSRINRMDKQIEYLQIKLKEEEERLSVNEYTYVLKQYDIITEKIKVIKDSYIGSLREINMIARPIHQYFINIFNSDYVNYAYLQFTPVSLLNIFRSSLYLLKESNEFLEFIVQFKKWLPSDYRCKYGSEIIKLLNIKDLDYKNKQIIRKFSPEASLLMDDIITMYYKSNKDKFPSSSKLSFILDSIC